MLYVVMFKRVLFQKNKITISCNILNKCFELVNIAYFLLLPSPPSFTIDTFSPVLQT